MNKRQFLLLGSGLTAAAALSTAILPAEDAAKKEAGAASKKINVLILTGQNNHDWKTTSSIFEALLKKSGRFDVKMAVSPDRKAGAEAMKNFKVDFKGIDVVLNDYNGASWPDSVNEGLLKFVKDGGGLVNVHAGNNPFSNWPEFNDMIGLGWRNNVFGDRISIDDATGKQIRTKRGEGPGAGHGRRHEFVVKVRDPQHPIMKGFPSEWLHGQDELYHGQRGPGKNMTVLSSAYADKKTGGTGDHEPITWFIPYGKGKSVTTVLGHQGGGQKDAPAVHCVGFQTVLMRCLEWAATGTVSTEVPDNFPTKAKTSMYDPKK